VLQGYLAALAMVVQAQSAGLEALGAAARAAAADPAAAADVYAGAALRACAADAVIVRSLEDQQLVAHAVAAVSPAVAAHLAGSREPVSQLDDPEAPSAGQLAHAATLRIPVESSGELVGALEIVRSAPPFDDEERLLAQMAADGLALAFRARRADEAAGSRADVALVLAGEALAAGVEEERAPQQVVRLAAEASGAGAALLWQGANEPSLAGSFGESPIAEAAALSAARVALEARDFLTTERIGGAVLVSVRLAEPSPGVLQLIFSDDPPDDALAGVATFALRAAHALRTGSRARDAALELDRTRALLGILGQATATLSLSHTLATTIEQTAELLGIDRVAVYLREEGRLLAAAGRALVGPHEVVAEALLGQLLGAYRSRGIAVADLARDPVFAAVRVPAEEAGIATAVALSLLGGSGDVIGLLALYPGAEQDVSEHEQALLSALAAQLGIAVQNARLHEQAKQLGADLEAALTSERDAARRIRALYEVSQSFAQSMSLSAVLESLAASMVELLEVDAAVIRMPDERRELLRCVAIHVDDARLDPAARAILMRPQSFDALPLQRLFRTRRPLVLKPGVAADLGGSHALLVPFLEKGSTAAVLPIATPGEVVATLTLVSFDPGRPLGYETLQTALSISAQAALAIDNGRLYQQQKEFADTMQRSLLPRSHPRLPGLEIGDVYESSAHVDVGGDVYDFMQLGDSTLAVVLGDVTGHGIEATADMAMAKFVFRSLAREHPDPGDFLAAANDVVVTEVEAGKFITMTYVTVDAANGDVVAASGGHPAPLLVAPDGTVEPIDVGGLALGVEPGQEYDEVQARIEPGGAVVLVTDGVLEARHDGELYGSERLAAVLREGHEQPAEKIAESVVRDCRAFAGGELPDDCAVVVIKRSA
jgi:serine phosphatase RsbU (regulator of sigma subunit)